MQYFCNNSSHIDFLESKWISRLQAEIYIKDIILTKIKWEWTNVSFFSPYFFYVLIPFCSLDYFCALLLSAYFFCPRPTSLSVLCTIFYSISIFACLPLYVFTFCSANFTLLILQAPWSYISQIFSTAPFTPFNYPHPSSIPLPSRIIHLRSTSLPLPVFILSFCFHFCAVSCHTFHHVAYLNFLFLFLFAS